MRIGWELYENWAKIAWALGEKWVIIAWELAEDCMSMQLENRWELHDNWMSFDRDFVKILCCAWWELGDNWMKVAVNNSLFFLVVGWDDCLCNTLSCVLDVVTNTTFRNLRSGSHESMKASSHQWDQRVEYIIDGHKNQITNLALSRRIFPENSVECDSCFVLVYNKNPCVWLLWHWSSQVQLALCKPRGR